MLHLTLIVDDEQLHFAKTVNADSQATYSPMMEETNNGNCRIYTYIKIIISVYNKI